MNPGERYRRLRWRCRRGMLELDLLLQGYLEQGYPATGPELQEAFARLLDEPDERLLSWINGTTEGVADDLKEIVRNIQQYTVIKM